MDNPEAKTQLEKAAPELLAMLKELLYHSSKLFSDDDEMIVEAQTLVDRFTEEG